MSWILLSIPNLDPGPRQDRSDVRCHGNAPVLLDCLPYFGLSPFCVCDIHIYIYIYSVDCVTNVFVVLLFGCDDVCLVQSIL